jgi:hypothetical protein
MSSDTATPSAQIIDFTEYRRRRAARAWLAPKRQFLWSWPGTGQVSIVEFPSPTPAAPLSHSR